MHLAPRRRRRTQSRFSLTLLPRACHRTNVVCNGCTDMIALTPTKCMNGFEYLCVPLEM